MPPYDVITKYTLHHAGLQKTMSPVVGENERDPLKKRGTFPVDFPELPSPIFIVGYGSQQTSFYII